MTNAAHQKPRVVFMGTPAFAATALKAILDAKVVDVIAVYTQPPRPANRGKKLQKSDVHTLAEANSIPVLHPLNFEDEDDEAAFKALDADLAIIVAYGLILPSEILDAPRHGCINIHASLLPRWRGAAPIHRAIEAGDSATGVCLMQMDAGLDTGDVIARSEIAITSNDTTPLLHDKLAELGGEMITTLLAQYPAGGWVSVPQPAEGVTYAKKIDKAEARIDWTEPAEEIVRKVRAFVPFPGAFFELPHSGERIKVLEAEPVEQSIDTDGGTVMEGMTIACGHRSALRVIRAQRAGKSAMSADDILRGLDLPAGTVLTGA